MPRHQLESETADYQSEPALEAEAPSESPAQLLGGGAPSEADVDSAEPGPAPRQPQPAVPAPQARKHKIDGREYTDEELVETYGKNADWIVDRMITDGKYRSLQRAHEEALSRLREDQSQAIRAINQAQQLAAQQSAQVAQPQPQPQRPLTPDEFRESMKPHIQGLVQAGVIAADTVEAVPDLVSMLVYTAQRLAAQEARAQAFEQTAVGVYQRQFQPIWALMSQARAEADKQAFLSGLYGQISAIAGEGGQFSDLAKPDVRDAFLQHLVSLNPQLRVFQGEGGADFIRDQFIAMNRKNIMQALTAVSDRQTAAAAARRVAAAGETAGARTGPSGRKPNEDIRGLFARG